MEMEYTYGVARIRALEGKLFSDDTIDQLLQCSDYDACMNYLRDKGWGQGTVGESLEEMLLYEREKTWSVLYDLVEDKRDYAVLNIVDEFHNLKAAIKQACTETETKNVYHKHCTIDPQFIVDCIKQGQYGSLPENMSAAAKEATEVLLKTGSGQLCDIVIDKASLEALKQAGQQAENELIKRYADMQITIANIKIALRSAATGKDSQFLTNALVPCSGISVTDLIAAIDSGQEAVESYIESAGFAQAVSAFKTSASVFECWCDNKIIEDIKSEKYNSFSIGPIIAYVLARENEIKTVKIILSGKINGFDNDFIKERVRVMYA